MSNIFDVYSFELTEDVLYVYEKLESCYMDDDAEGFDELLCTFKEQHEFATHLVKHTSDTFNMSGVGFGEHLEETSVEDSWDYQKLEKALEWLEDIKVEVESWVEDFKNEI